MDPADIDNFFSIGYRPQPIVRYIVMQSGRGISVGLKKYTMLQGYSVQAILRLPVEEQRKLHNALQLKVKDLIQYPPKGCKMPQMCYFCRKSGERFDCELCANRRRYNEINSLLYRT